MFGKGQFARLAPERPRVAVVGSFDGVHLGHQRLVELGVRRARCIQGELVVLTFWPLPGITLGRRGSPRLLTTPARRARLLADLGVDALVTLHFDSHLAGMSPEQFVREVLVGDVSVREVCVGFNFRFGARGAGSAECLQRLGEDEGFGVWVLGPVSQNGHRVSSTVVRDLINLGWMARAARLLGRPHIVEGTVVRGRGFGRLLGFPTANVHSRWDVQLPPCGVYAVEVCCEGIGSGVVRRAVANVGGSPTMGEEPPYGIIEVHVPGFDGSLYGCSMEVGFLEKLRDIRAFSDSRELSRQIGDDVARALLLPDGGTFRSLRCPPTLC